MVKKKIKVSDILGDSYYVYELSSSNYTPALNGTITITCTMKDVYGTAAGNKSITLYQNGTSKGAQTTNSSGVATWSITCSTAGLQIFSIKDTSIEVFVDNKEDTSNKVTSLSSSSTDTQYPSAKCVYDTVDIVDDKVSVVYNPVSIIDTSDSVYDADRWTEYGTMSIARTSKNKVIGGGGSENGYVIYNGNISNLDNYDITLNLKANRTGTNVYINDNNIGTLPTSQTSILFKKRDGVVKVVYNNNQYNASAVKFMSSNAMSMIRYTIDVVLYQGMIYDVINSIPSKTSDLTNDSGFLTSHQDITGKEDKTNKSSSISTDTGSIIKYPTVKAVEDYAQPKGNYLTQHQSLKTINNETLVGNGDITIDIDEEIEYIELSVDENVSEYAYVDTIELYGTSTKDTIDNTTTNAKFLFKMPSISDELGSSNIYIRLHYNNGNSYRTGMIKKGNSVYRFDDAEKLSNAYVLVLLSEYSNSIMFFDIIFKSNYAEAEHIHSLDTLRFGNDFDYGWESISLFTQDNDNKSVDVGGIITLDYSNNETKATYNRNLGDYSKDYYEIATIEDIGYTIRENIGEYVSAVALSNDYDDLDNKPTIPTATSDLTNDSGFLTSHQSLANYVQKSNTTGLLKNDGTVMQSGTGASNFALGNHTHNYASSSHNHNISDLNNTTTVEVVVTYTDNTTETLNLLKYTGS